MATTIKLDRPRSLVFDVRALCAVEDHYKAAIFNLLSERMGLSVLAVMLWQGLKKDDPQLTLETTQDLLQAALQEGRMEEVMQAIKAAVEASGLVPKAQTQLGT